MRAQLRQKGAELTQVETLSSDIDSADDINQNETGQSPQDALLDRAKRVLDRLDQQAVIINSADDFAIVVEYVLPHHGSMRYAVQSGQAV